MRLTRPQPALPIKGVRGRPPETLAASVLCFALAAAPEPVVIREKAAAARKVIAATSNLATVTRGFTATLVLLLLVTRGFVATLVWLPLLLWAVVAKRSTVVARGESTMSSVLLPW